MLRTVASTGRPLRRTAAAIGAVTLIALAAVPASAEESRPGLVVGPLPPVSRVEPGGSVVIPGTFANRGTTAYDKVFLSYEFSRGLLNRELPSNCILLGSDAATTEEGQPGGFSMVCEFDQTVRAGGIYAPEKGLSLKVLDYAMYEQTGVTVSNYDPAEFVEGAEPGTAPAVKLVELPPTTPVGDGNRPSSQDGRDRDYITTPLNVVNTADLQVAARETGRVGNTVTLEADFVNAGPAWVAYEELRPVVSRVLVKLPAGTTVTKAYSHCDKTGALSYSCRPTSAGYTFVRENTTESFPFTLRVDKVVPGAKGSVALETKSRPYDTNKKNDATTFTFDVPGSGSTGGGGATGDTSTSGGSTGGSGSTGGDGSTSSSGGSGSTGDSGATSTGGSASTGGSGTGGSTTTGSSGTSGSTGNGGLADTGSGPALPLAGTAAAVLAAGAGTVLLVRRRAARN
ncbi:hypothetical protein EDD93_2279 [Streptomyces sp. 840.1]|uniref:hypothetical protein n=1 Tax=Streptomyces sp. 840.1 TaxID=2485152 RepID=UPI000F4A5E2B|nr:hypothetical protein [Streptomyces sp. 840.1]ROQ67833.1 hypothetical protein EDD93_2279 [Streptomyces sp. 840.1]